MARRTRSAPVRDETEPPIEERAPEREVDWEAIREDEIDIDCIYGRNDMRASDFEEGQEILATFDRFRIVTFPPYDESEDDRERPRVEITFREEAPAPLHKTFCPGKEVVHMITPEYGSQVQYWKGKQVVLYIGRWKNGGKSGERINMRVPTAADLKSLGNGSTTTKRTKRQTRRR